MMSRDQREQAYAAIGALRRASQREMADAVSQALADLHDYEVKPSPLEFRAQVDLDNTEATWTETAKAPALEWAEKVVADAQDIAPEIYTYWVVYAYRAMASGLQELAACRHERSTPILSCEDRMSVAQKISDDTGRNVIVISATATADEVEL